MTQIKVLLADDHPLLLDGLSNVLSNDESINVIAKANNGNEVLKFLASNDVDVAVLDINMPELNGIETAKKIKSNFPQTKVIAVSSYVRYSYVHRMLKNGALSYLSKSTDTDILIKAIKKVNQGERYLPNEIQEILFSGETESTSTIDFLSLLTRREKEVLNLIAKEMTSKEIAKELFLSEETIRTHRKNIFSKFNVKNMAGLIKKATDVGIL